MPLPLGRVHNPGNSLEQPPSTIPRCPKEGLQLPSDSPRMREKTASSSPPPQACAQRRQRQGPTAAPRSASGRSSTPTPPPGAPKRRRRTRKRKITPPRPDLTRPRSFRDERLSKPLESGHGAPTG